jgi:hypothetical protein
VVSLYAFNFINLCYFNINWYDFIRANRFMKFGLLAQTSGIRTFGALTFDCARHIIE